MRPATRHITSALLIFCLVAPIAGTVIWLHWEKLQNRSELKEIVLRTLSDDQLVVFAFTQDQEHGVTWKGDDEFEYAGAMYDVVRSKSGDGVVEYWCWHDRKESDLNKQLDLLIQQSRGNPVNDGQHEHLQQFLRNLFCTESGVLLSYGDLRIPVAESLQIYPSRYLLAPPSPPPEMV